MRILVIKTPRGLLPVYDSDLENYCKIAMNEEFEIEYTKKRNLKFHKKYFALMKLAFENQQDYRSLNDMRRDIAIVSGFYDEVVNKITGEILKVAKSISFSNMEETEFSELYEKTKDTISKWLGISDENIENEIMQYF
jgi:hypothetical protein